MDVTGNIGSTCEMGEVQEIGMKTGKQYQKMDGYDGVYDNHVVLLLHIPCLVPRPYKWIRIQLSLLTPRYITCNYRRTTLYANNALMEIAT